MGSLTLAYSPFVLAVVFRAGLFSFFSAKLGPVWPKPAPDRAGAGRSPTWGVNSPHRPSRGGETLGYFVPEGFSRNKPWLVLPQRGLLGADRGLGWFCGMVGCEWFPQCREERKGRRIPLEGSGQDLRHLPGLSKGCKEAMRTSVLFSLHTICSRFCYPKHKMSKCAPYPFAPLHPSFFSQPIPFIGQADGLHIAS